MLREACKLRAGLAGKAGDFSKLSEEFSNLRRRVTVVVLNSSTTYIWKDSAKLLAWALDAPAGS